jgi:bifunctional DNA-binding transcriptional regulator/antitoxin component of YhaV-PrlF toxin-antitoxin module
MTLTVDEHGAIRLPAELLCRLGARAGTQLEVEPDERGILVRTVPSTQPIPLSKLMEKAIADLPPGVVAQWPTDGADEHDHYIYGTPKRR